jgi:hypothetical protein
MKTTLKMILFEMLLIAGLPALAMNSIKLDELELPPLYDLTDKSNKAPWQEKYWHTHVWPKSEAMYAQEHLNDGLIAAIYNNNEGAVKNLLDQKAEAHYITCSGGRYFTALHKAAEHCNPNIIKMLINANANVYQADNSKCKFTPLMLAITFDGDAHPALDIKLSVQYLLDEITRLTPLEKTNIQQMRFAWLCCSRTLQLPKDLRILIARKLYEPYARKFRGRVLYTCDYQPSIIKLAEFATHPRAAEILANLTGQAREDYEEAYGEHKPNIPAARLIGNCLDLDYLTEHVHTQTLLPKRVKSAVQIQEKEENEN